MTEQRVWVLAGGIGSGKSTVGRLLEELGADVINADSIGHDVLLPNGPAFRDVAERWPQVLVCGQIDRTRLADIVFADPAELRTLEKLTHPHIREEIERRIRISRAALVFVETSVLHVLDEDLPIVVVDAPDEIRLERLESRGMARADAKARMEAQLRRPDWMERADRVIPNDGDLSLLREVVGSFWQEIAARRTQRPEHWEGAGPPE